MGIRIWSWGRREIDGPDAGIMISRTCCEMAHVWRKQHASDIGCMCLKRGNWDERSDIAILEHAPDVDISLILFTSVNCSTIQEMDRRDPTNNLQNYSLRIVVCHLSQQLRLKQIRLLLG